MEPAIATVLGAAIGAAAGITGGVIAAWRQGRLEHEKWLRARQDAAANELRVALQQWTIKTASAVHSMCWLTWVAHEGPGRLTQEKIDAYDKEMHTLLPEITGLQAVIAAINEKVCAEISVLVNRVTILDVEIGNASLKFTPGSPESARELGECFGKTQVLHCDLPKEVARISSQHSKEAQDSRELGDKHSAAKA